MLASEVVRVGVLFFFFTFMVIRHLRFSTGVVRGAVDKKHHSFISERSRRLLVLSSFRPLFDRRRSFPALLLLGGGDAIYCLRMGYCTSGTRVEESRLDWIVSNGRRVNLKCVCTVCLLYSDQRHHPPWEKKKKQICSPKLDTPHGTFHIFSKEDSHYTKRTCFL